MASSTVKKWWIAFGLIAISVLSIFIMTNLFGVYGEPVGVIVWLSLLGLIAGISAAMIAWLLGAKNLIPMTISIVVYNSALILIMIGYAFQMQRGYSKLELQFFLATIASSTLVWLFIRWLSFNTRGLN